MTQADDQFRAFYAQHQQDIWRYCLRRLRATTEAEEVFNSTFVVAWQNFADIPEGQAARPWLFAVARNHIRNRRRKSARYYQLTERLRRQPTVAARTDPADLVTGEAQEVRNALDDLSPDDQELLRLVAWEDLSHADIGIVLGCSENAVAIRLHRARARLAKRLPPTSNTEDKSGPQAKHLKGPAASRHVGEHRANNLGKGSS